MAQAAQRTNNNQSFGNQAPQAPQWLMKKAKERVAYVQTELEQAKKRIPSEYHDFLILLQQNEKLNDNVYTIDRNGQELGMFSYNKGTYLSIEKPYVTVDGRVQMLKDEHQAANKKFQIHPPQTFTIGDTLVMSVTVESEIYGSATGVIEVGLNGRGVDAFNPIANAQTSAIGRALGFLGYGLVGTGVIASPEELRGVQNEEQPTQTSGNNKPLPYRLQVIGKVVHNPDGSATVSVKDENLQPLTLVLPVEQREFANKLADKAVIQVFGWLNPQKSRIVVANNSQSVIE